MLLTCVGVMAFQSALLVSVWLEQYLGVDAAAFAAKLVVSLTTDREA